MAISPGLRSDVVTLVASAQATTRTELSAALGAPASTISAVVQALIDDGFLTETGTVASTGGRPRRRLAITTRADYVIAADIGSAHAAIGVVDAKGALAQRLVIPFSPQEGPDAGMAQLSEHFDALIQKYGRGGLTAIGVALPGPVRPDEGALDSPSRVPNWHLFPVRDVLQERFGVPVLVENDANMMAFGEYTSHPEIRTLIAVKAGTAIGAGLVVDGRLYRGRIGAAGDITHVRVSAAGDRVCGCGNTGCLETVASGAALVRELRAAGLPAENTADIVELARHQNPRVTQAFRDAGSALGEVLAAVVNFTTPDAVYLGGAFAAVEPFVATLRSRLYDSCHPLATRNIVIDVVTTGTDASLLGVGRLALTEARTRSLHHHGSTRRAPRNA